jgi:hypothetical protein
MSKRLTTPLKVSQDLIRIKVCPARIRLNGTITSHSNPAEGKTGMFQRSDYRKHRWANSFSIIVMASIVVAGGPSALPAAAVTLDDFQVQTAKQLADLCRVTPSDSDTIAAAQFCQGFMTGAYHYHVASLAGPAGKPVVCFANTEPSRGKAAAEFVTWLDAHPQYANEDAVETQFKWMTETWPCK